MKKHIAGLVLILCLFSVSFTKAYSSKGIDPFPADKAFIDSVYNTMTLNEKIGQLLFVAGYSNRGPYHLKNLRKKVTKYGLGGIIFFQGGPSRQIHMTNELQRSSRIPLLIAMDAEWGLDMRMKDSTFAFPWSMTMGAMRDNTMIYKASARIAQHLKRIGVHFNFAPSADINNNPQNPIIGNRSFGENRLSVLTKSRAYIQAHRHNRVLSSLKHFPGHGDTSTDSHKTLPTIPYSRERLDSLELYPFKNLIRDTLPSVMVAHLNIPALTGVEGVPSSISKGVIHDLLQTQFNYKGLVVTDALNMKGLANHLKDGEKELAAFMAGNDILLMPEKLSIVRKYFREAYFNQVITEQRLEHSVKKILRAKYWTKLFDKPFQPISTTAVYDDIQTEEDKAIKRRIFEEAATVIKNKEKIIPVHHQKSKYAWLKLGDQDATEFDQTLSTYIKYDKLDYDELNRAFFVGRKVKDYETLIVTLHQDTSNPWKPYKMTDDEIDVLETLAEDKKLIFVTFNSPYGLIQLDHIVPNMEAVLVMYQHTYDTQQIAAQILGGALPARGKIPVNVSYNVRINMGEVLHGCQDCIGYESPVTMGLDPQKLKALDALLSKGIDKHYYPGVQFLVARKNKIVYHKAFGHHTYQKKQKTQRSDIYDLASITKVASTTAIIMKMVEQGKLDLDKTVGHYLPIARGTNKEDLILRDILMHRARLRGWIPFYKDLILGNGRIDPRYIAKSFSSRFNRQVADNMYSSEELEKWMYSQILESDLLDSNKYVYSDLGYYLLKKIIELLTGTPLDELLEREVYAPIGMFTTGYNPLRRFPKERVVPTEVDKEFRMQTIQGYVHDPGAALLDGVAGHAGLFSNAVDLSKLFMMFANYGKYNGQQFLKPETLNSFTQGDLRDVDNRRAIGFDKQHILGFDGSTCRCGTRSSYGHFGFTGTMAWVDPKEELVILFLSNRVYPTAKNYKFSSSYIRAKAQKIVYDAIIDKSPSIYYPYGI